MTKTEATKLVVMMATAFPVPAWSVATIEQFAENLEDLEFKLCEKHVRKWIREHISRPTICDIRRETRMDGFVC